MKTQIPLMIFIAGIGIIIGLLLQRGNNNAVVDDLSPASSRVSVSAAETISNSPDKSKPDAQPDRIDELYELTTLHELVQNEVRARKQLQAQLDDISFRLQSLENNPEKHRESGSRNTGQKSDDYITESARGDNRHGWINAKALADAGLDEVQTNKIRQIYEEVEMERLYLRDRAVREGWMGDDRYRQEREQLDAKLASLRDELSEKEYDAYLFATGRPNRVIIQSTLNASPAGDAGIKAGDSVLRYNNTRVYSGSELRTATTQCAINSMVEVETERDGQKQSVYVPCGPLGVRLDGASVQP